MENYLVSVIIPVYNGSDYVAKAIESALNQTYKNIEVIVINDGSKDDGLTKKAVEPYLEDKRVRYYEKENGGVSTALNMGIELFKGDFFNWLSHDDMLAPRSIELRLKKWCDLGKKEHIIISSDIKFIDKNGKNKFRVAAACKDVYTISDILTSTINGCSLLIPRKVIEGHQFKVGMVYMPDYYLWAQFINEGVCIRKLHKVVTYNRVHDKQITFTQFELLEKDFNDFEMTYVRPLLTRKDYKQVKRLVFAFTRRLSVRPFYWSTITMYKVFLKSQRKWNVFDDIHIFFDKCVSLAVKILRRIK